MATVSRSSLCGSGCWSISGKNRLGLEQEVQPNMLAHLLGTIWMFRNFSINTATNFLLGRYLGGTWAVQLLFRSPFGLQRGIVADKAGTVTREVMLRTLVWRALGALTCKGTCLPLQHFLPYKTIKATRFCCFSKNCFIFEFLIKASAPQRPSRAFCICPILLALAGGGILALQVLVYNSFKITPKQQSKQP